jgi:hypothetical protein
MPSSIRAAYPAERGTEAAHDKAVGRRQLGREPRTAAGSRHAAREPGSNGPLTNP